MRLLHVSDLHIGKRLYGLSLLDDQRYVLEGIIDLIKREHVDVLLISGDLYDRTTPSAEVVALLDWFLAAVADTGCTLIAISGNHDAAERIAYGSSLLAHQNVFLSPVYNGEITHVELEDEYGPVTFWLIPFLKPSSVRPFFPDAEIADYTDALRCAIDGCAIDESARNVALAHQFVTYGGIEPEAGGSEMSLGGIENVDVHVFDPFDYVALGHIHRPQMISRDTMRYSGSPLKYSFGEARGSKSAPLIELGPKGEISIELLPLPAIHDLREIKGELDSLLDPATVQAAPADDYLHVILTDETPAPDALSRLRAVYPNVLALDCDNSRTRAAGSVLDSAESDLSKSSLELFEEFYEQQNGAPMSEAQRALAAEELERAEVR